MGAEEDFARIIVIGDLHGIFEPLARLLDRIRPTDSDLIVFIGDYIDRGPDSKEIIDALLALKTEHPATLFLKGNHEDMLLGSAGKDAVVKDVNTWLYNGGAQTLLSYGMSRRDVIELAQLWDEQGRFRKMASFIPEEHLDFYQGLILYFETEHYFICHAGVSPLLTIEEGKLNTFDLLWMRDHIYSAESGLEEDLREPEILREQEFPDESETGGEAELPLEQESTSEARVPLEAKHKAKSRIPWEKTVVCGHTPQREVLIKDRLICIDTGLYYYGKLSAIDLLSKKIYQVKARSIP